MRREARAHDGQRRQQAARSVAQPKNSSASRNLDPNSGDRCRYRVVPRLRRRGDERTTVKQSLPQLHTNFPRALYDLRHKSSFADTLAAGTRQMDQQQRRSQNSLFTTIFTALEILLERATCHFILIYFILFHVTAQSNHRGYKS